MPDPAPNEPKPDKAIVPDLITPKSETALPSGFDPLVFWIQYRGLIKMVCAIVLLGAAIWGSFELMQYRKRSGSEQALAASKNPDDLRKVIAEWDGTPAAGSAHLLLASELRAKGNYDDSAKVLNDFAAKYPTHSLIPESIVSLGVTLESAGKLDEAIEAYKRAAAYPASPLTPAALVFQARVLIAKNKPEDAKKLLTDAQTKYKDNAFTVTIGNELLQDLENPSGMATGGSPRPTPPPAPPTLPPGAPGPRLVPPFPGGLTPGAPAPAPGTPAPAPGTPAPAPGTPAPAPGTPAPAPGTPAPAPGTPAPAPGTPAPVPSTPAPAPGTPAPAPAAPAPVPSTPAPAAPATPPPAGTPPAQ